MILYPYRCESCGIEVEKLRKVEDRDKIGHCANCGEMSMVRILSSPNINVPEGACGNAKNGYSSTHGDAENFKAGRKVYK